MLISVMDDVSGPGGGASSDGWRIKMSFVDYQSFPLLLLIIMASFISIFTVII